MPFLLKCPPWSLVSENAVKSDLEPFLLLVFSTLLDFPWRPRQRPTMALKGTMGFQLHFRIRGTKADILNKYYLSFFSQRSVDNFENGFIFHFFFEKSDRRVKDSTPCTTAPEILQTCVPKFEPIQRLCVVASKWTEESKRRQKIK